MIRYLSLTLILLPLLCGCIPEPPQPDNQAPQITLITDLSGTVDTDRPSFSFSSDEKGSISWSGSCHSNTDVSQGTNLVSLQPMLDGTYSDCLFTVADNAGNVSTSINLSTFTIDAGLIKLDNDGIPLADQSQAWDDAGNEATYQQWSCVKDNDTGLIWEVKRNDDGLRHHSWTYSWYDSNPETNGGDHGSGDLGLGVATGMETVSGGDVGSDNCYDPNRCDTEKYIEDINAAGLCGASDWRLPTGNYDSTITSENEIETILNCTPGVDCNWSNSSSPASTDTDYFPFAGMSNATNWTSSTKNVYSAYRLSLNTAGRGTCNKGYCLNLVRLVRNAY